MNNHQHDLSTLAADLKVLAGTAAKIAHGARAGVVTLSLDAARLIHLERENAMLKQEIQHTIESYRIQRDLAGERAQECERLSSENDRLNRENNDLSRENDNRTRELRELQDRLHTIAIIRREQS